MKRVLVSAAEASGDRLGAELVDAMAARGRFLAVGLGGPKMVDAGVLPLRGATGLDPVMGGLEVLRHVRSIAKNSLAIVRAFDELKPDVFVPVDAPDFHLPLARAAKARGIKVVGYVSPQLWAWRSGRAAQVARSMDRLLCLFPFEPAIYAPHGLDALWVGHPAVDRVRASAREEGVVAIFPGSRKAELRRLLRPFLAAVRPLGAREVLLPLAGTLRREDLGRLPSWVRVTTSEEALARASLALTKSGTTTLELALAGVPFVVAHRVPLLTYLVGRLLVRGVRHLALPNILLGREAVREYVQFFTPGTLSTALRDATPPPSQELRTLLGEPGVAARAADAVWEVLGGPPAAVVDRPIPLDRIVPLLGRGSAESDPPN